MAQEIGVAYVSLLPSGKGFSKGVQSEAESAFKGADKSSTGFFSNVTKWAKRGALVVGGMVTAVGALAVGGGIARALNIEDATAKLKGLGHDTKTVEQIMNDALASVKGTAFGLDSAATLAASAVAAGIKPGRELERYLRLTADAATIAGGSLDELGSVMNNVTTLGAAYNDSLQILAQKGLPIYQWLADEIGVTTDEVKNLASQGKISAETFRAAIEKNIAGAALSAGDTTRGALANMMSSLSRLGEAFAGPAIGAARDFFKEITEITDGIKLKLAPAFDDLQYAVDGLDFNFSDSVLAYLNPILETINDISAAARDGSLSDWFEGVSNSSPFLSGVVAVAKELAPLLPVLQDLGAKVAPVLADALGEIADALEPLIPLLAEGLADAIVELAPPLTDLLIALLPIIPPLVELLQEVIPPLTDLMAFLVPIVSGIAEGFSDWLDSARLLSDFINGSTSLEDMHRDIQNLQGPIGDFTRVFFGLAEFLAVTLVSIENDWKATWSRVGGFFSAVGEAIVNTGAYVWNLLPEGFRNGVSRVVGIVRSLPGTIQRIMAGVGSLLVGSGRALMQGFIDGINSMIGSVGSAVNGVLSWAAGFFPHSPAERGVFSGAGWTDVEDGGASLMEQFAFGAEKFKPEISFSNLVGLTGVASAQSLVMPSELVVRDVDDGLVGRMRVEAVNTVGSYDSSRSQTTRRGVRLQ